MGWWRGTYRPIDNEEGSQLHVFGLSSDGKWKIVRNDTEYYRNGYISPYRAYFLPKESIGDSAYDIKFTVLEGGGDDPTDFWTRLPGGYEADLDYDETGIRPIIHTIDADGTHTYYDLQGRKLGGKPTRKGVYINNGKVIINK